MKPSNTGIDWMDDRGISPEELASAVAACDLEVERFGRDLFSDPSGPFIEYLDLCYIAPAIVRLAIAEYRKEAKAEWQRELAAKVEDAFCELKQALAEQGSIDAFDLACIENALVDFILNENDHAE